MSEGYHVLCDDKEEQVDDHGHKLMLKVNGKRLFRSPLCQKSMQILDSALANPGGLMKWLNATPGICFQQFQELLPILTCPL